jgi:serine/threonine protein kinase
MSSERKTSIIFDKTTTLKRFDFGKKSKKSKKPGRPGEILGRGKYGEIVLVKDNRTEKLYALKVINKNPQGNRKENKNIRNITKLEIASHSALSGLPNVIDFYGWFETASFYFLIVEFIRCKNMYYYHGGRPFTLSNTKKWARDILIGLKGIHDRGYVHADMKPENVMMTCDKTGAPDRAKLADFGFTSLIGSPFKPRGTPDYLAPEILEYANTESKDGATTFQPSIDMWAFGCMVYEMLDGNTPFYPIGYDHLSGDELNKKMFRNIINMNMNVSINIDFKTKEFIKNFIIADPKKRMTSEQALNHPWITGTIFEDIV